MATRSSGARTQEIHRYIIENVSPQVPNFTAQVAKRFGISRQAAHRHIRRMVTEGALMASGETKDRRYALKVIADASFTLPLSPGLEEDVVWREKVRPLLTGVARNVLDICLYGFTEMLNNAIDHSGGRAVLIRVNYAAANIQLKVADNGIGIFKKIKNQLGLADERESILELAKGKFTTDPAHHTGEGIFFTSRAFDRFEILSGNLAFQHREPDDDWLVEIRDQFNGTIVHMQISAASQRTLPQVFEKYTSDEDFGFQRTRIPVKLARYGDENLVSRSQAKRLVARFEKFKQVELDFEDVESIGQAFADEIFRVFSNEHPNVNLSFVNANKHVEKMIKRALENK